MVRQEMPLMKVAFSKSLRRITTRPPYTIIDGETRGCSQREAMFLFPSSRVPGLMPPLYQLLPVSGRADAEEPECYADLGCKGPDVEGRYCGLGEPVEGEDGPTHQQRDHRYVDPLPEMKSDQAGYYPTRRGSCFLRIPQRGSEDNEIEDAAANPQDGGNGVERSYYEGQDVEEVPHCE